MEESSKYCFDPNQINQLRLKPQRQSKIVEIKSFRKTKIRKVDQIFLRIAAEPKS